MIDWRLQQSWAGIIHSLVYGGEWDGIPVQMLIHTPKRGDEFGKQRGYYYIIGINKEFRSEDDLIDAVEVLDKVTKKRLRRMAG